MHPHRGLSLRLQWVGPLGRNCYRGGGRGLGFGIPTRSAGRRRPLRGPATGQAVGEPGRLPRPVSCAGRSTTGHDLRRLVCAHNNGQGLGSPGPSHQGKRRRVLGTSSRVGRGRLWVPGVPNLPGRHPRGRRGRRGAGAAPVLHKGRRREHDLGRQQAAHPAASGWPQPGDTLAERGRPR